LTLTVHVRPPPAMATQFGELAERFTTIGASSLIAIDADCVWVETYRGCRRKAAALLDAAGIVTAITALDEPAVGAGLGAALNGICGRPDPADPPPQADNAAPVISPKARCRNVIGNLFPQKRPQLDPSQLRSWPARSSSLRRQA
jgi:hypothetical protein